jgi:hypothetical protein
MQGKLAKNTLLSSCNGRKMNVQSADVAVFQQKLSNIAFFCHPRQAFVSSAQKK